MFFFGSEYFFLLTVTMVTLSAKKNHIFEEAGNLICLI